MLPWPEIIDPVAGQNGFSGVVSVDRGGETEFVKAYGLADRAHQIPNTAGTRFAIASGTKRLTALTVVSLISDGALSLSPTARGYLRGGGRPMPNVFHLPVLGSGDGGIYATAADITALWQSLCTGKIVPAAWVAEMGRARSDAPPESMRYGLGFWLGRHSDT